MLEAAQAAELFYPAPEAGTATRRRPDFLAMLGDDDYRKVYERVAGGRPRLGGCGSSTCRACSGPPRRTAGSWFRC